MPLDAATPSPPADESVVHDAAPRRQVWRTPRVIHTADASSAESTINFPDDGTAENS